MKKREHLIFSGRVQGVGFRYRAYYLAETLNLYGYVKNLYDGTVEMEVEGEDANIDRLIMHLKNNRYIRIDKVERKTMELTGDSTFRVLD